MKIRTFLQVLALSCLVTVPALAAPTSYNGGQTLIITTPSALFGSCTVFYPTAVDTPVGSQDPKTGCEQGTSPWEGPGSILTIDPAPFGNPGTDLPVIVESLTNSNLTQEFSCATTSNLGTTGVFDPVEGCRAFIQGDTFNNAVPLGAVQALTITPDDSVFPGGYAVTWPDLNNDPYGGTFNGDVQDGQGTFCDASCDDAQNIAATGDPCSPTDIDLLEGGPLAPGEDPYCTRVLGLIEEDWSPSELGGTGGDGLQQFINPLPIPTWYFSSDFSRVTIPASTAIGDYQIFSNALLGNAIRGNLVASTTYTEGAFRVPLAPLAALGALGGTLAFMGYSVLRRRE